MAAVARGRAEPSAASSPASGFECNICLEEAAEPVVTLCGHLFCWPCIYKWLHLQATTKTAHRHCPVCKSAISRASLVPLYGRGAAADASPDVPRRPAPPPAELRPQLNLFGGTAVAVLPWVLGDHWMSICYSWPYRQVAGGGAEARRVRREEVLAKRSLHRVSVFLFFCLVLCLLLF
ncbi:E3 ubiquitin-protein ligase RMA3-like [Wolffia australiana]